MTSDATPITILSVDDHPLIRAGIAAMVESEPGMRIIAEASNGEEALEQYRRFMPDVVLMDLKMPVMDGLDAAVGMLSEFPAARIIMLTTYDGDEDIHRALEAGIRGYLIKDMIRTEIIGVIRTVYAGNRGIPAPVAMSLAEFTPRVSLTPRELEVLKLMARGFSNPEIARHIGRTEGTAKVHVKNVLQKLGANDRTEAVMVALQRGFIHLD